MARLGGTGQDCGKTIRGSSELRDPDGNPFVVCGQVFGGNFCCGTIVVFLHSRSRKETVQVCSKPTGDSPARILENACLCCCRHRLQLCPSEHCGAASRTPHPF